MENEMNQTIQKTNEDEQRVRVSGFPTYWIRKGKKRMVVEEVCNEPGGLISRQYTYNKGRA